MKFTTKRGRPCAEKPKQDKGTPELQNKKHAGENREVIDYLTEKSILTAGQQFAANRFRWLYTIRYGLPHITAANPEIFAGRDIKLHDEIWLARREREFTLAISELRKINAHKAVMNACLYNITSCYEIKTLQRGLSALDKLWSRARLKG